MIGIYCITHMKSGHFYIGSTGNFKQRKYNHTTHLNRNVHCCKKLQELFNDDSALNFTFFPSTSREVAYAAEGDLLELYKNDPRLCNTTKLCNGGLVKHTEASLRLMAEKKFGKTHTVETLNVMSLTRKGKKKSKEWSHKIAESRHKSLKVNEVIYQSLTEAAAALNLSVQTVANRCHNTGVKFKDWLFV